MGSHSCVTPPFGRQRPPASGAGNGISPPCPELAEAPAAPEDEDVPPAPDDALLEALVDVVEGVLVQAMSIAMPSAIVVFRAM